LKRKIKARKKDEQSYFFSCFSNKKKESETEPLIDNESDSGIEMHTVSNKELNKMKDKEREMKEREEIIN